MDKRKDHKTKQARGLRRNMTDAEWKLWLALRDRRLKNYKFRRQFPVKPYIVDFICLEYRLIIEVDGGQHAGSANDERRTKFLMEQKFKVIRFWNNEVLENMEGVLLQILEELAKTTPSPRPSPARGEGED